MGEPKASISPCPGRDRSAKRSASTKGQDKGRALVSGLTVGNKYIATDQVATIYGGRAGYPVLDCKGL
jgi:hypothetical protein